MYVQSILAYLIYDNAHHAVSVVAYCSAASGYKRNPVEAAGWLPEHMVACKICKAELSRLKALPRP